MKLACILVVGVLFNAGFLAAVSPSVVSVAGSALSSIQVSLKVLDFFKGQQKYIPFQEFADAVKKLEIESQKSYSDRARSAAGEAKTLLQDALDTYLLAEQSVYEWCGVAVERFESYLRLLQKFSLGKAKLQQRIVLQVLDEALRKFTLAQDRLEHAARSFAKASESVASLIAQLNTDFDSKSGNINKEIERLSKAQACVFWVCWNRAPTSQIDKLKKELQEHLDIIKHFDEELKNEIVKAVEQINQTKAQLKNEIDAIGQEKTKAAYALDVIREIQDIKELDDVIQNEIKIPVGRLIEECRKYREHHIAESETFHAK